MAGIGRGFSLRMARSTRTQRKAAPPAMNIPTAVTNTASHIRTVGPSPAMGNASMATPPARNANDVRVQARNVRSLARVKRGSGSFPSGKTARARAERSDESVTIPL